VVQALQPFEDLRSATIGDTQKHTIKHTHTHTHAHTHTHTYRETHTHTHTHTHQHTPILTNRDRHWAR
jgi:hypothetical protein